VVEVVGVANERATRSDGKVSVHVQIDAENRSVLGIFRLCVRLFDSSNVEVVVAATVMKCRFAFLPFLRKVRRRWYVLVW
jgi:hypothetical protein